MASKRKHTSFECKLKAALDFIEDCAKMDVDNSGDITAEDLNNLKQWIADHPTVPHKSISEYLLKNSKETVLHEICNKILNDCADTDFESWVEEWLMMVERFNPWNESTQYPVVFNLLDDKLEAYERLVPEYAFNVALILFARFEMTTSIQDAIEAVCSTKPVDSVALDDDDDDFNDSMPALGVTFNEEIKLLEETAKQLHVWSRVSRLKGIVCPQAPPAPPPSEALCKQ
jgi:hypothetical protein